MPIPAKAPAKMMGLDSTGWHGMRQQKTRKALPLAGFDTP
jgi:hypothetical protein